MKKSEVLNLAVELMESGEFDYPGICLACGEAQDGCEPDMRRGQCEHCGERKVYGCEEIVLQLAC